MAGMVAAAGTDDTSALVKRLEITALYEGSGEESALPEEAADRINALKAENERMRDALTRIDEWADAYPVAVFPEPNISACAKALADAGQASDALHASWARHLLGGVKRIVRTALTPS